MRPLSLEEYLALEREAPVKRELVEGFRHAMAGTGSGTFSPLPPRGERGAAPLTLPFAKMK